jgi:hypothetical protein
VKKINYGVRLTDRGFALGMIMKVRSKHISIRKRNIDVFSLGEITALS